MAEPVNKLVRVAEQDVPLPIAGGNNKIEPSLNLLSVGYDKGNKAFAQNMNYIFDNLADWIAYSQERLNEVDQTIIDLTAQIEKERVSVGEIIEITGDNTNPSVLKGYGTWESFGAGQVLVGVGSRTDDRSESKSWVDGQSEGEYRHVQTEVELASHIHPNSVSDDTHNHEYQRSSYANDNNGPLSTGPDGNVGTLSTADYTHDHVITIGNTGESSPMNNLQPSLAVYRWKRVA